MFARLVNGIAFGLHPIVGGSIPSSGTMQIVEWTEFFAQDEAIRFPFGPKFKKIIHMAIKQIPKEYRPTIEVYAADKPEVLRLGWIIVWCQPENVESKLKVYWNGPGMMEYRLHPTMRIGEWIRDCESVGFTRDDMALDYDEQRVALSKWLQNYIHRIDY